MPQSPVEKVFGELIRTNRVQRFGCDKRDVVCEQYKRDLGAITPEILRDMEDGNLVGTFGLSHMITMINFLWDSKRVRLAMLAEAHKVESRILEVASETALVGASVHASRREKVPPLPPHRERL
jgi:hypothetical protein